MSGLFVKKATDALHSVVEAGIAAQLRIVETAEGIAAGSLTDPVAVLRGAYEHDNRSPHIQVYGTGWVPLEAGQRMGFHAVACVVFFRWSSDARLEDAEDFVERYIWALYETVNADPTLGGVASGAYFVGSDMDIEAGDESTTQHEASIAWSVHVES